MQLVNFLWIGLLTVPQAFAWDVCTGQNFGYKAADPADPHAYYLCLGLLGKIKSNCQEGSRFNLQAQICTKDNPPNALAQRDVSGVKNEFNINQNITMDRPIIINILGSIWNKPPKPPYSKPTPGPPITSTPLSTTSIPATTQTPVKSSTAGSTEDLSSTTANTEPNQTSTDKSSSPSSTSEETESTDSSTEISTTSSDDSSSTSEVTESTESSTELTESTDSSSPSFDNSSSTSVVTEATESSTENSSSSSDDSSSTSEETESTDSSTESSTSSSDDFSSTSEVTEPTESSTDSSSSSSDDSSSTSETTESTDGSTESSTSSSDDSSSTSEVTESTESSTENSSSSSDHSSSTSEVTESTESSTENSSSSSDDSSSTSETTQSTDGSTEDSSSTSDDSSSTSEVTEPTESSTDSSSSSSDDSSSTSETTESTDGSTESSTSSSDDSSSTSEVTESTESSTENSSSSSDDSSSTSEITEPTESSTDSSSSSSDDSSSTSEITEPTESSTDSSSSSSDDSSSTSETTESTDGSTESSTSSSDDSSSTSEVTESTESSTESSSSSSDDSSSTSEATESTESSTESSSSSSDDSSSTSEVTESTDSSTEISSSSSEDSSSTSEVTELTEGSTDSSSSSSEDSSSTFDVTESTDSSTESSTSSSDDSSPTSEVTKSTESSTEGSTSSSDDSSSTSEVTESTDSSTEGSSSSSDDSSSTSEVTESTESSTESSSSLLGVNFYNLNSKEKLLLQIGFYAEKTKDDSENSIGEKPLIQDTQLSIKVSSSASISDANEYCRILPNGAHLRDSKTCSMFYVCANGRAITRKCPKDLYFDIEKKVCNVAQFVNCFKDQEQSFPLNSLLNRVPDYSESSSGVEDSSLASNVMESSERYPKDLSSNFMDFSSGLSEPSESPLLGHLNSKERLLVQIGSNAGKLDSNSKNSMREKPVGGDVQIPLKVSSYASFSEASEYCKTLPNGAHLRDATSCNKFYVCANGQAISRKCPTNLYFDIKKRVCNFAQLVNCFEDQEQSFSLQSLLNSIPDYGIFNLSSAAAVTEQSERSFSLSSEVTEPIESSTESSNLSSEASSLTSAVPEQSESSTESSESTRSDILFSSSEVAESLESTTESSNLSSEAFSTSEVKDANEYCRNLPNGVHLRDSTSCNQFYVCANGRAITRRCPTNLYFDIKKKLCNLPHLVNCFEDQEQRFSINTKRTIHAGPTTSASLMATKSKLNIIGSKKDTKEDNRIKFDQSLLTTKDRNNSYSSVKQKPGTEGFSKDSAKIEEISECSYLQNGAYLQDPKSCNRFYICSNGRAISRSCPQDLYFDIKKKVCNFPSLVKCVIGDKDNTNSDETLAQHKDELIEKLSLKKASNSSNNISAVNSKFLSKSPISSYKPVKGDSKGSEIEVIKTGMSQNSSISAIHEGEEKPVIVPTDGEDTSDCTGLPNGSFLRDSKSCGKFYVCSNGRAIPRNCPGTLYFDIKKRVCNFPSLVDCSIDKKPKELTTSQTVGKENSTKSEEFIKFIPDCSSVENGDYIREPRSCSKFYVCANGKAIPRQCPKGLYVDTKIKFCNFPSRVDCSIDGSEELPTLPAALSANIDCSNKAEGSTIRDARMCNKYYVCQKGTPVTHFCAPGNWFDQKREVCDQKKMVECNN